MIIETWFSQDIQKPVQVQHIDGNLFSHNGNGNRIGVELTNGGEPYTVSGTVSGYVVLSDGTTVPCLGSHSGNKASILIPPAAYLPGNIFITVFVTDGTTVTTIAAVSSSVVLARTDTQVDPGSVITDWTNTINAAMQEVETSAENLGGIVATPYAQLSFPVPFGKYTYYNGGLYRCISPIASSETFTPAHWMAVRVGDDVVDLSGSLNKSYLVMSDLFKLSEVEFAKTDYRAIATDGSVVTASYVTNKITSKIKATSDIYVISGSFDKNETRLSVAFYESDDSFISGINIGKLNSATEVSNFYIVVPQGTAYFQVAEVYSPPATGYSNPLHIYEVESVDSITETISGKPSQNLFNPNNVVVGKFKDASVGNTPQEYDNSAFAYIEIELEETGEYILSGTSYYALVVGADGKVIRRLGNSSVDVSNLVIDWVYGDEKLVINYRPATYPTSSYMVVKGSTMPAVYQRYDEYQFNEQAQNTINRMIADGKAIYHLGATREYTSFIDFCTAHANDTDDKILYIDQGIYDIFDEIGGADYCATIPQGAVWEDVSVVLPPNTHIIGIGSVVFNFNPTTAQIGNGLNLLSPLNVVHSATIENITINASNCRYGIHDEEDTDILSDKIQQRVYRNVRVNKSGAGFAQAFGAGVSDCTDYLFDHCVFKSTLDCFSYHSAGGQGKNKAHFVIDDCVFISGVNNYAVRFGNVTYLAQEIPVFFSNCYIGGKMKIGLETNYGLQNFNVTMTNCNKALADIEIELKDGDTNAYPPTVYNW